MKILITGYKGFVGTHLFKKLKSQKHYVIGYDKNSFFLNNFPVDLVYHLAAYPKALESIKYPDTALDNIKITFKTLNYMKNTGCKKIIFASSTEIVGLKTPYSASKLASENLIEAFCNSYGFGAVSLRFSNIYGPNDRSDRFIPTAIRKAKKNKPINIFGKEGSFTYIDDCINIYLKAINLIELKKHKIYKVSNKSISLVEVAEKIIKLTNSKIKIKLEKGLKKCL
jgi:nucleoside-diphosphate-sugar epimerase